MTSTKPRKRKSIPCVEGCPVERTLHLIGGKWKGVILYHLLNEKRLRFGELKRRLPSITQRMLTKQLRELENDALVLRDVFPEVPPRVEYSLTPEGESLRQIIKALEIWGKNHTESSAIP